MHDQLQPHGRRMPGILQGPQPCLLYTSEDYLRRCGILREIFDHPAITTAVIAGFPGETEEEFEETRRFLETVRFYEMHVFKYSKRQGTRAAVMEDQVSEQVSVAASV